MQSCTNPGHFGNTTDAKRSKQTDGGDSDSSSDDDFGKEDSVLVKQKLEEEKELPCNRYNLTGSFFPVA